MGGMLSVWLAEHHPEIAAIAVVDPLLSPPDADTLGFIQAMVDGGDEVAPGIGSDIAMEGAVEAAYPASRCGRPSHSSRRRPRSRRRSTR